MKAFWRNTKKFFTLLWENRTRTFAAAQGLVAVLAGMTDIFGQEGVKWLLAANALLTYALGTFNSWQEKNQPPPPPPSEQP